jgi:hypothetical protein
MIWHHVIPYSLMRNCWNVLASNHSGNAKAKNALQIYMQLLGIDRESGKELIRTMANGTVGMDHHERIAKAVAYAPWNIVEGPKNRSDDPGEDFDAYRIGLFPSELNRHGKLKVLFNALKLFNDAIARLKFVIDDPFINVANELSPMIGNTENATRLIPFRETMWMIAQPAGQEPIALHLSKWKKRRSLQ